MLGPIALAVAALGLHSIRREEGDRGILWRLAAYAPEILASSVLFWILTLLGTMVLSRHLMRHGVRSFSVVYFSAFLTIMLASELLFQKYFDPFVLLMVFLMADREPSRSSIETLGIVIGVVASVAYFFLRPGIPTVG